MKAYLPETHRWIIRTMRVPKQPTTGDRGPVIDAFHDVVDAAGLLEYSRGALHRTIGIAQEEWEELTHSGRDEIENWTGASTGAVYYDFYAAVTWTRTIRDRFQGRLRPSVKHDQAL